MSEEFSPLIPGWYRESWELSFGPLIGIERLPFDIIFRFVIHG
jgi:hypothetical protein